ncbi:MAG: TonB-dependent receptor [Bacteroidota bacterium]
MTLNKRIFNNHGRTFSSSSVFFLLFGLLLLGSSSPLLAQRTISGTVSDPDGTPLIGANVVVEGTSTGTITDFDGKFELALSATEANMPLTISYTGYLDRRLVLTSASNYDLVLALGGLLDEVIVTGVFDQRSRIESSVAISVLKAEDIQKIVPNSAADLLRNVPGVFVNSSLGEIRNTVYSRGISVGSNDGATGYTYVSMQEDGLPVTNATFSNFGPDFFLRQDISLGRLEAVRGGTASILGNNAPGGIFNYVSKTGGTSFEGEVQAKFGLEGNGRNPYYRLDANFGGPLSKDQTLTYNVGGFWRQSDGARYPGYPMNEGGQIKANILKTLPNNKGSIKLYGKYLNDKNAWFEFLPTVDFDNPRLANGFEQTHSVLIPSVQSSFSVNQTDEIIDYNSEDKVHSQDLAFGLNLDYDLGNGWTIDNKARYSSKSSEWNTTAAAYPFDVSGLIWYALAGQLGQFGLYSFNDLETGNNLANVTQAPLIVGGNFAGFDFQVLNDDLPGGSAQPTSLLFNPLFYTNNQMDEFINQMTVGKSFDNMDFTVGFYYANSQLDQTDGVLSTMYTQLTRPRPTPTSITYVNPDGVPFQLTNAKGIFGDDGQSAALNLSDATQNQLAFFAGQNWKITPNFTLDWGIRYERLSHEGTNQVATAVPTADPGGLDGNPQTIYDNREGRITGAFSYDESQTTFSFSAGLNYQFSKDFAIYGRYSEGRKAQDMDLFTSLNSDAAIQFLDPIPQETRQVELGLKARTGKLNIFLTPFYTLLDNIAIRQLGQETDDISTTYATPTLFNGYETYGVELEGIYEFTNTFNIRAVATVQESKAVDFSAWDLGANGQTDDRIVDFSGNETDNNANIMLNASANYSKDKLFATVNWSLMGERVANVPNAFNLPAFDQTNLSVGYRFTDNFQVQANINNVFNQEGIMGWSAPGGFPAALDRQGFTSADLAANPNAVYSSLSIPPRAYFLTLIYKF